MFGRVTVSTRKTCNLFRTLALVEMEKMEREELLLVATAPESGEVGELTEYTAYCCATRGRLETTVAGKVVASNFFHGQWVGKC